MRQPLIFKTSTLRVLLIRRKLVLLLIVYVLLLELDALCRFLAVLMHIEITELGDLYNAARDIRAVIGDSLEVGKKVGKNKAVLDRAFALLETNDVIKLYLIAKIVNDLLDGLYLDCGRDIVINERLKGDVKNIGDSRAHDPYLRLSLLGEGYLLILHFLRRFNDVYRVVGDTLKVTYDVQELSDLNGIRLGHIVA